MHATVTTGTIGYSWSFGDGATSTAQNPSHAFTAAGTYLVKLAVTTNNGCSDSAVQTIIVHPQPTPGFVINNNVQCFNSNNFSFTNTSTISSGSIAYNWSFGDGGNSAAQNPVHAYTAVGTYQVKLIVTSNNGCKDSSTQTITVYPPPTGIGYIVNAGNQCLNGNNFVFTSNAAVVAGTLTYNWDFGDGGNSALQNPSHSYASAGTYQVKLVVTTNYGCKDSSIQTVIVYPQPEAGFTINNNAQCLGGNNFSFTNTSSISNGNIIYRWDFGDGQTSTVQDPTHTFAAAGTYIVKLLVGTDHGCNDSAAHNVTVYPQPLFEVTTSFT